MSPKRDETRGTYESPSSNADEQKLYGRRREGYVLNREEQSDDNAPTFMLDVPVLNVDEIDLEVNDLRAHVSLRTELADLVKINVGVDIYLDKVKLGIKGVEAQALLTISLDKVLGTLNRALEAIDKNPQILSGVAQDVDSTVGSADRGAQETDQEEEKTSQLTGDAAGQVSKATEVTEPDSDASSAVESEEATGNLADLQIQEEYIDDRGRIVGRARDEAGNLVEEVLDEEGEALDLSRFEAEEDQDDEMDATDAARRKASELSVNLFEVKGTGSGGRILVKDVERAAKQSTDSG